MPSLYELDKEYQAILASWEELENPEAELSKAADAIGTKLTDIWKILRNMEGEEAMLTEEIAKLMLRKGKLACRQKAILGLVSNVLPEGSRWQDPNSPAAFAWHKCPPSVEVTDETAVPEAYLRVKTVREPAKSEILKDLKAGADVPGCRLVADKMKLKIL